MRLKNLTLLNILITFALIMWGAVVHNTQSSLACPDWPLCYDQFFPKMEGAILIEHGHRLLASLVGFITICIVYLARKQKNKSQKHLHLFKASLLALFVVIAQGVLGGITVIYKLPTIVSTTHLGTSLIYFSILIYIQHIAATLESPVENFGKELEEKIKTIWKPSIRHGVLLSLAMLYSQILLGAFMRHAGVGAACGLGPKSALLCLDVSDWSTKIWPSLHQSQLHMVHRLYAVVVAAVVVTFSIKSFRFFKTNIKFSTFSILPTLAVLFQVFVGVLTVYTSFGVVPTTLHLAGAALSLGFLWKLNLMLKSMEEQVFGKKTYSVFSDIVDLTKPRLSLLVMVTALVGSIIAPNHINFFQSVFSLFLILMVVIGAAALNCYIERDIDAKMERTKDRPLPAKRMEPKTALLFGVAMLLVSIPALFLFVNTATGILAIIAAALYLYAYTPMKVRSELAVYIGAIPGALPPVMGWTAVTGQIDVMAITLFLILFVWQLPHFLAISMYLADDYDAASIKVYPNLKKGIPLTKMGIFVFTVILFITSLLPSIFSQASFVYTRAALVISGVFVLYAARGFFVKQEKKERQWARNYFYGSLFYLPLLLGALIFFK
jgi:protoheme IX farnesyltransferase